MDSAVSRHARHTASLRFNPPPGWPDAPRGFVPSAEWEPDPSWPAAPQGWVWWKPVLGRRSHTMRVTYTVLMVLAPLVISGIAGFFTGFITAVRIHAENYATMAVYRDALNRAELNSLRVLMLVLVLGHLTAVALIARKVSYRWWDFLLLFIPGFGIYVYFKLLWRFTNLPERDWPQREDETPVDDFASLPLAVVTA